MKKYQNWLDCELYKSHLQNLVQIKKRKQTFFQTRCQTSFFKHKSHHNSTYQKRKGKLKESKTLYKEYFIKKENEEFGKRLRNVPPVISAYSFEKQYEKNHWFSKKKKNIDFYQKRKQVNMKIFFKILKEKHRKGFHRYFLKFKFFSLPELPFSEFQNFRIELATNEQKTKSDNFTSKDVKEKNIQLLLHFNPKHKEANLNIHYSKGLEYYNGGEYRLWLPSERDGQQKYFLRSLKDSRKTVSFFLKTEKIQEVDESAYF